MINVITIINEPLAVRQKHLALNEPCLERGGGSMTFQGILAQYLNTTIPLKGSKICLCHACHNGECSNPRHVYWGTYSENIRDAINAGALNPWQRTVNKYGYQQACRMNARGDKSKSGRGNAGKPKTKQHKKKISIALIGNQNARIR